MPDTSNPDRAVAVRGFSQVFLARLKQTKQRVVVKKLCLQGLSAAQRAKTWAEAEVMLSLKVGEREGCELASLVQA
jgi:hypothetical protein